MLSSCLLTGLGSDSSEGGDLMSLYQGMVRLARKEDEGFVGMMHGSGHSDCGLLLPCGQLSPSQIWFM
jgi:hypothetical protein